MHYTDVQDLRCIQCFRDKLALDSIVANKNAIIKEKIKESAERRAENEDLKAENTVLTKENEKEVTRKKGWRNGALIGGTALLIENLLLILLP